MSPQAPRATGLVTLTVAALLIGLTLRGPITGIPPLLSDIAADLSLTPAAAGLATTLPLIAFAVLSPIVPELGRRLGVNRAILLSLLVLGLAIGLRPWFGSTGFLLATLIVGAAITVGNVLMPVVIRREAGKYVPQVMAASISAYGLGQGLTAFAAVPAANVVGWRWSVALPVVLVGLAVVAWLFHRLKVRRAATSAIDQPASLTEGPAGHWRDAWVKRSAWWLALFFGMQSLLFYTASTWTPEQLVATGGLSQVAAGNALTVFHLFGIAGTLLVPFFVARMGSSVRVGLAIATGWSVYFSGLFLLPEAWLLWMVIGGVVQGAGIGLAMTLIATRPINAQLGRRVSGMVQCVAYSLAAVGPPLIGGLAGATGGWLGPTVVLLLCTFIMAVAAPRAAAAEPIA